MTATAMHNETMGAAAISGADLAFDEASKIYTVLKVAIDQLALVGVINVDMREQATLLTASVGREISSMIDRQAELGARFEELIAQQHQLRKDGNANRQTEVASEIKLVGEQLRSSISTLCGKLKGNPNVAENLAKISGERQLLQTLLHAALDELESTRQLGGILAMVQSEKSRHKEIQDMVEREKAAARAVVTLRLELSDEQEQHDKAMRRHQAAIATLKDEMRGRNKYCHVQECHVVRALAGEHGCDAALREQEIADLEHELAQLNKKLLLERHVQMATDTHLASEQADIQAESAKWHERAVADSRAEEHRLEELKAKHRALLQHAKEVEAEHDREKALQDEREAAAQAKLQAEAALRAELAIKNRAAARIQAQWRGVRTRRAGSRAKDKKGKVKK